MGKDIIEILEDKGKFIRAVEAMLDACGNNMVDSLSYQVKLQPGCDGHAEEQVNAIYTDSTYKPILATGSSKEDMLKNIMREVYGWKII